MAGERWRSRDSARYRRTVQLLVAEGGWASLTHPLGVPYAASVLVRNITVHRVGCLVDADSLFVELKRHSESSQHIMTMLRRIDRRDRTRPAEDPRPRA